MIRFLALILAALPIWSDAQSERICEDGQRSYFGVCPEGNATRPPSPRPTETLLADRYRDHGDGTVTDVQTGLQWMRCSLGQTWQGGTCTGEAGKYTWQAAMDASEAFNRQGGAVGYNDWRMPTKEELKTLIYCSSGESEKGWSDTEKQCAGNFIHPTIYRPAFPNMPNFRTHWRPGSKPYLFYWTSSPHPTIARGYGDMAWAVDFFHGGASSHFKEDAFDVWYDDEHVRLVRGGL